MLQAEVLFKLHVLPQIYLFIYFWLNSVKFIAIIRGKKGGGDGGGGYHLLNAMSLKTNYKVA